MEQEWNFSLKMFPVKNNLMFYQKVAQVLNGWKNKVWGQALQTLPCLNFNCQFVLYTVNWEGILWLLEPKSDQFELFWWSKCCSNFEKGC